MALWGPLARWSVDLHLLDAAEAFESWEQRLAEKQISTSEILDVTN